MTKRKINTLQLAVLLIITQLTNCPTVKYNNPTDGAGGPLMQLIDTLVTTFAGANTSLPELKAVLTGNPSAITEGQTATVQIKLSKAITSNLTVTLSLDNSIMTIDGAATKEFTFTPDNATTEQSFTLAALADENSISETVNLKITATGLTDQSFSISTIDNTVEIVQTVIFTGLPSTITEGQTSIVQVKLAKEVTSALTVVLILDNPAITVDESSFKILNFAVGSGTVDQTIVLSAVSDTNSISETVNMKVSVVGLADRTFSISTIDNTVEVVQAVEFTGLPATITEGQTTTVQVKLAKEVTSTVTLVLTLDNSAITIDGSSFKILTFGVGSGTVNQSFTLAAVSDTNSISETVNLKSSTTGLADRTFSISTIDNTVEVVQAVVFTGLPTTMTEGQTTTVQVKLAKEVTSTVTVTLILDNSAITVDGISSKTLTFVAGSGTSNQSFTLGAVKDSNLVSETVNISVAATGLTSQTYSISTIDNTSPPPVITVSNAPTSITEGQTGVVGIKLSGTVTENFIVTVTSGNTSAFSVSPSILIFTPANFSVDQTVTLSALQDANVVSEKVIFTLSATGLSSVTFDVTSIDDDILSIVMTKSTRVLNGGSGQLSVSLSAQPSSDVTVNFVSSNTSALTLNESNLTLTASNYNQSQSFTVNCMNQTPMQYTVTASASGVASVAANVYCLPSLTDSLVGLMRTGQTTSYATGDDGTHQRTIARNYTDNGDGTVTDGVGRIWQKCSRGQNNDSSCSGFPQNGDWTTAGTYCSSLNLASKTWRLPTVQELSSLVDVSKSSPMINTVAFPVTQSLYYWSSTTYAINTINAWGVTFGYGTVLPLGKTSNYHVRCVSGLSTASSNFTDNSDGTITDSNTKLVWQKCSNGQNAIDCSGKATTVSWDNAITYCNGLSLASKTWRLPSRNELQSIVDYTKASSPVIATAFPSTQLYYHSSTTYAPTTTEAWEFNFSYGDVSNANKTYNDYIRCVSGP